MNKKTSLAALVLAALLAAPSVFASEHVEGVIKARATDSFTVTIAGGSSVTVILTETTKILLNRNSVDKSQLVPGLEVKIDGTYDEKGQLVAKEVSFGHSEQRSAGMIKGGLAPTQEQVDANAERIEKAHGRIDQHAQTLDTHKEALDQHGRDIVANDMKMVATTGRLSERIENLDDYNVVDKLVVYFKNGKTGIAPDFAAQLQQFAEKAKGYHAYKLQVQGYASAVGPLKLNETLSHERAENVTAVLQRAGVPSTNILVPAAMGTSEQFAENKTTKGQAENRRVVVTLLQNKGIVEK